jgi:hypothetical protein
MERSPEPDFFLSGFQVPFSQSLLFCPQNPETFLNFIFYISTIFHKITLLPSVETNNIGLTCDVAQ